MDPKKVIDFIEACKMPFVLGSAVKAIVKAVDYRNELVPVIDKLTPEWKEALSKQSREGYIQALKDARNYINIEIRRHNSREGALRRESLRRGEKGSE